MPPSLTPPPFICVHLVFFSWISSRDLWQRAVEWFCSLLGSEAPRSLNFHAHLHTLLKIHYNVSCFFAGFFFLMAAFLLVFFLMATLMTAIPPPGSCKRGNRQPCSLSPSTEWLAVPFIWGGRVLSSGYHLQSGGLRRATWWSAQSEPTFFFVFLGGTHDIRKFPG